MSVKRLHLFEWEDLPSFPTVVRNVMTDFLRFALTRARVADAVFPVIEQMLEKTGQRHIVDLCSGSGGLLVDIHHNLNRRIGPPIRVTYTDKFPNVPALDALRRQNKQVEFIATPIDASDVPPGLKGMRTMFLSFHHFRPDGARAILSNARAARQPIVIIEVTNRSLKNLSLMMSGAVAMWLLTPAMRPVTASRILWTYVVPIAPLCFMWDGVVSALRTYSPPELDALVRSLGPCDGYRWETGTRPARLGYSVTCLIGYPITDE